MTGSFRAFHAHYETFSRANGWQAPHVNEDRGRQYVSDMLIALTFGYWEQAFAGARTLWQIPLASHRHHHENAQRAAFVRCVLVGPAATSRSGGQIINWWLHTRPRAAAS